MNACNSIIKRGHGFGRLLKWISIFFFQNRKSGIFHGPSASWIDNKVVYVKLSQKIEYLMHFEAFEDVHCCEKHAKLSTSWANNK